MPGRNNYKVQTKLKRNMKCLDKPVEPDSGAQLTAFKEKAKQLQAEVHRLRCTEGHRAETG